MQPLHLAATRDHVAGVEQLLALGAEASAADGVGKGPLHVAAQFGHMDLKRDILESSSWPYSTLQAASLWFSNRAHNTAPSCVLPGISTSSRETTAADVDGWDSLMHINLIIAIEKAFGLKFATAEISDLKEDGRNVGDFADLVQRKLQGGG